MALSPAPFCWALPPANSYHPGPCEWFGLNCLSLASRPLCQTQASAPRCLWGRRGAGPVRPSFRPSVRPGERCQAPEGSVSTLTARVGHGCAWQKLGMPGSPCARGLEQALMPAASCPAGEGGQAGRGGGPFSWERHSGEPGGSGELVVLERAGDGCRPFVQPGEWCRWSGAVVIFGMASSNQEKG